MDGNKKSLGLLFDLDGTLLDTLEDLADAVNYALRLHGYPPRSLEEIRRFVGNGAGLLIRRALPENGAHSYEAVLSDFRGYYDAHCQVKTRPYAGILEALKQLGQSYPIAIVSNKPDSAVKQLCRQYFPGIYALGETPDCPRKPARDMLDKAMRAVCVESCIYIGDSEVDITTAQNAEVPCLSVLWGFRDKETLEDAGGQFFCHSPARLPDVISVMEEQYGK